VIVGAEAARQLRQSIFAEAQDGDQLLVDLAKARVGAPGCCHGGDLGGLSPEQGTGRVHRGLSGSLSGGDNQFSVSTSRLRAGTSVVQEVTRE
jgi:hypothetical protein